MFAGTILVSLRVTKILKALSFAVEALDLNAQISAAIKRGEAIPNIQMYGMHGQAIEAEKIGTRLLIAGFSMQVIGVAFNVMSFLV